MINFPYTYQNGNTKVTICENGAKTREWSDGKNSIVEFPEQADIKITNYCDLGDVFDPKTGELKRRSKTCPFCHEASNTIGKHANLKKLWPFIKQIGAGKEYACGGGAPLKHPDFEWFAKQCQNEGIILNITNNILHMKRDAEKIAYYQREKLIYGLGISYRGKNSLKLLPENISYENVCFHCILGIDSKEDIIAIQDWCAERNIKPKILLLGYKIFRNGEKFFSEKIKKNLDFWREFWILWALRNFGGILSFDNLALEQLELENKIDKKTWQTHYQGKDSTFSFYIDAVNETFAGNSTRDETFPIKNLTIKEAFKKIKT